MCLALILYVSIYGVLEVVSGSWCRQYVDIVCSGEIEIG